MNEFLQLLFGYRVRRDFYITLPAEIAQSLETYKTIINDQRERLGSAQGGSDNWGYFTSEDIITEAIKVYLNRHLKADQQNGKVKEDIYEGRGQAQMRRLK